MPPNSSIETAVREEISNGFLPTETEPAQSIPRKILPAQPVLCDKSLPEDKPWQESMTRNSQWEPNYMTYTKEPPKIWS
jgi:hypothetical protein